MLARYGSRASALVRALVVVPFVLPTVVVGSAFLALGVEPSLGAILLAHVFFNYAVVVRTVGGLWSHLDPRQEEAARVLGASRWRAFRAVTLPALRPAIVAAAAIVFLFTFTSFGVILVLGGPTRATLETEIYRQTTAAPRPAHSRPRCRSCSSSRWSRCCSSPSRAEGRRTIALVAAAVDRDRAPRPHVARARRRPRATSSVMAVAARRRRSRCSSSGRSTRRAASGFGFYRALGSVHSGSVLFVPPTDAIRNSLVYAVAATAIAVVVGGLAAFAVGAARAGASLDAALSLPLGVSAVTVGFGFLIALDEPPLDLRTSWILVPIAHALVAIPFVVRIIGAGAALDRPAPARGGRGRSARRPGGSGARSTCRSPPERWPSAAGFAFAISLGEFGATVVHRAPGAPDAARS